MASMSWSILIVPEIFLFLYVNSCCTDASLERIILYRTHSSDRLHHHSSCSELADRFATVCSSDDLETSSIDFLIQPNSSQIYPPNFILELHPSSSPHTEHTTEKCIIAQTSWKNLLLFKTNLQIVTSAPQTSQYPFGSFSLSFAFTCLPSIICNY